LSSLTGAERMAGLTINQLQALTTTNVLALTTTKIGTLLAGQITALSATQIAALTATQLDKLTVAAVQAYATSWNGTGTNTAGQNAWTAAGLTTTQITALDALNTNGSGAMATLWGIDQV
jgi:hypothetical protein